MLQINFGTWLVNRMKRKKEVLMSVEEQYDEFMLTWAIHSEEWGIFNHELIPYSNTSKEEHLIIANAANKFWDLINI